MANEKRLIDANALIAVLEKIAKEDENDYFHIDEITQEIFDAPTVDAVEVPDKKLLKAINLLIKQYEHSKNSDYVHSPVAHAFYYTWKQLDEKMDGDGNGN